MKPFYLLLTTTLLTLLILWVASGEWHVRFAGNVGMSVMLLFTALGHFMFSKGMAQMLPPFVPYRVPLVWITGVIEVAAAIGLMIPSFRHLTALWLILFFILILPANIYAAFHTIDYQKGTNDGPGLSYLWLRMPLQLIFIAWVWFFSW